MVKPTSEKQNIDMESKYKGVRKRKWGKYVSEIRLPNSRERIWLGSYDTPEKAARAFDAAVFCLRGRKAKFNFPDNPPEIPGGTSLAPTEIQAVAARFANEAPPLEPMLDKDQLPSESPSEAASPSSELSSSTGSDIGLTAESELTMDWSFLESLGTAGLGKDLPDYGGFPVGFNDFSSDVFAPVAEEDLEVENWGGIFSQSSFLWNF